MTRNVEQEFGVEPAKKPAVRTDI